MIMQINSLDKIIKERNEFKEFDGQIYESNLLGSKRFNNKKGSIREDKMQNLMNTVRNLKRIQIRPPQIQIVDQQASTPYRMSPKSLSAKSITVETVTTDTNNHNNKKSEFKV